MSGSFVQHRTQTRSQVLSSFLLGVRDRPCSDLFSCPLDGSSAGGEMKGHARDEGARDEGAMDESMVRCTAKYGLASFLVTVLPSWKT